MLWDRSADLRGCEIDGELHVQILTEPGMRFGTISLNAQRARMAAGTRRGSRLPAGFGSRNPTARASDRMRRPVKELGTELQNPGKLLQHAEFEDVGETLPDLLCSFLVFSWDMLTRCHQHRRIQSSFCRRRGIPRMVWLQTQVLQGGSENLLLYVWRLLGSIHCDLSVRTNPLMDCPNASFPWLLLSSLPTFRQFSP